MCIRDRRIADGGRLTKTEEEKAEEIPWREDEGIYISYNWEGHSAHIVDYLGFVLAVFLYFFEYFNL